MQVPRIGEFLITEDSANSWKLSFTAETAITNENGESFSAECEDTFIYFTNAGTVDRNNTDFAYVKLTNNTTSEVHTIKFAFNTEGEQYVLFDDWEYDERGLPNDNWILYCQLDYPEPSFTETELYVNGNGITIHHGTRANQATNFYINDMHTKSLGTGDLIDSDGNFLKEEDEDRYQALSYDKTKQVSWLETLKLAQNQTLDTIYVKTRQNANVAVRVLDGAIDYALDESTRLGAYLQRLEYTDSNIVTMNENVQASESQCATLIWRKKCLNILKLMF